MSDKVVEHLEKKILSSTDSKDALNYAKGLSEIVKAEAERDRVVWAADDQIKRTENEIIKTSNELEFNKKKLENEAKKIEADERVQTKRYQSEERYQRYRAERTSKDNALMALAYLGGVGVMFGSELKGLILSKEVRGLSKFIKFR